MKIESKSELDINLALIADSGNSEQQLAAKALLAVYNITYLKRLLDQNKPLKNSNRMLLTHEPELR